MSLSDAPANSLIDTKPLSMTTPITYDMHKIRAARLLVDSPVPHSRSYMSKCNDGICYRCAAAQHGGKHRCPSCGRMIKRETGKTVSDCTCGCRVAWCKQGFIFGATEPMPEYRMESDII